MLGLGGARVSGTDIQGDSVMCHDLMHPFPMLGQPMAGLRLILRTPLTAVHARATRRMMFWQVSSQLEMQPSAHGLSKFTSAGQSYESSRGSPSKALGVGMRLIMLTFLL